MIAEVRAKFDISDEEALFINQVTEEKAADPSIGNTVQAHLKTATSLKARIAAK